MTARRSSKAMNTPSLTGGRPPPGPETTVELVARVKATKLGLLPP